MSESLLVGRELRTRPLGSMVSIDPESLPLGTKPSFEFHYFDISCAASGRLQMPDMSIAYAEAPSRARRIVKNGDVLMSTVRPNLKAFAYCNLPEGSYVASTGFAVLRAIEGNDARYILYSILSDDVARQIDCYVVGSNYPAINSSDVKRLQMPDWEPPQQRRIAEILSTLDEAIEQTEALIAKYQKIKAGLMHDLFTRGVTPDGHLRPTRTQAPHLYKDSPLGWVPKEWEVKSCSEICAKITVGIVIRPAQYYVSEGIPAFRSANVREAGIDPSDLVFISPRANILLAKSQLQTGDVISVRTGYPGTSAVVPTEFAGSNCIDLLISRPSSSIRAEFLVNWINSSFGKDQVLRKQGGLAQQHFNVRELRDLLVVLPKMPEQNAIIERLASISLEIENEQTLVAKLRQQKHGLMQDLLTGRVRVKVAEAEEKL